METQRRWQGFRISDLFSNVWALITLIFLTGIALSLTPGGGPWSIAHAISDGLIVVTLVALFWHLKEVRDFFLFLAEETLIKDSYLKRLSLDSLRQLRIAVASVI